MFLFRLLKFCMILFMVVYAVFFALKNQSVIEFRLPPLVSMNLPVYIAMLGSFFAGGLLAAIFFGVDWVKKGIILTKLRRQLRNFEHMQASSGSAMPEPAGKILGEQGQVEPDVTPKFGPKR